MSPETRLHDAKYTCEAWFAISRIRGCYHSVDHAQFPKGKAHDTVANPELLDRNIQKAFITVSIVQARIS
jgi:hypothetical protein